MLRGSSYLLIEEVEISVSARYCQQLVRGLLGSPGVWKYVGLELLRWEANHGHLHSGGIRDCLRYEVGDKSRCPQAVNYYEPRFN